MKIPYSYQEVAIAQASKVNTLLGDKCGLGKTLVGIETYKRNSNGSLLWVTRKNAKRQLELDFYDQFPEAEVFVVDSLQDFDYGDFRYSPVNRVCITHYEAVIGLNDSKFRRVNWDWIIGDECHYIKNRLANRSKAFKRLKSRRKLAMSATPANKKFRTAKGLRYNPEELYSVVNWLHPKQVKSFSYWYDTFVAEELSYGDHYKPCGVKNLDLYDRLLAQLFLQRTKPQVASDLPPLTTVKMTLQATPEQARLYKDFRRACKADILVGVEGLPDMFVNSYMGERITCQRLTSTPRLLGNRELGIKLNWLDSLFESDEQVLVATAFKATAELIANRYKIPIITGDQNTFVAEEKPARVVGTIQALAGAFNMGWLDSVVFFDLTYSTINAEQVRDRIHRIDITSPKTAYYLVVEKTFDNVIFQALQEQWDHDAVNRAFVRHILES